MLIVFFFGFIAERMLAHNVSSLQNLDQWIYKTRQLCLTQARGTLKTFEFRNPNFKICSLALFTDFGSAGYPHDEGKPDEAGHMKLKRLHFHKVLCEGRIGQVCVIDNAGNIES